MISWIHAAENRVVNPGPTHLRVVLDQLCLLHDLDIPLTAIGLLGDRDADQFGRLVLGIGHGVRLSLNWITDSGGELGVKWRFAVRASN